MKLIDFYRAAITPYRLPVCRFFPGCSSFAKEAIALHGAKKGVRMALKRLIRCHPFHPGGVDLVPRQAG